MRAKLGLAGPRVISAGVGKLSVDEDQYTTSIVTRLAEQLREHGLGVESGADHLIEI